MARLPVESNDTISLVTSDSDIIGQGVFLHVQAGYVVLLTHVACISSPLLTAFGGRFHPWEPSPRSLFPSRFCTGSHQGDWVDEEWR